MEVLYKTFPIIMLTAKQPGQELEHGKENRQMVLSKTALPGVRLRGPLGSPA